ncbi:MAG: fatty acid desaturase [Phycisphaerales bacterium]
MSAFAPTSPPAGVPKRSRHLLVLAYSPWDLVPVLCGVAHLAYVLTFFWFFDRLPWWGVALAGAVYAVSVSWNINGISHNFIHNPYFRSGVLNRLFSLIESLALGFSQTFYDYVHTMHHVGNSDRPDEHGHTADPLSIYKHGEHGLPENAWTYTFLSFFRDDPQAIYKGIRKKNAGEARWGVFEIIAMVAFFVTLGILNWRFIACFVPCWYLGHCLSYLNGYFEHYAGNPDKPIAWGVSTYHRLYNWIWFNNGYHAEHHYRPRLHWTRMREFHEAIEDQQQAEGVRVIRPPHALGFLDRDLPTRAELAAALHAPRSMSEVKPPEALAGGAEGDADATSAAMAGAR